LQTSPTKILAVTVTIFFFTTNLSGSFLPIYLRESGLSIPEIVVILFFTFLVIGLLPITLLRATRNFERIISLGILFTLLFYVALIYVKNPVLLGLAYGLGIATFWPSFNLLMFRLSDVGGRAFLISLLSVAIPSITGIVSPAVGGFIIEAFGFVTLFAVSILLYLAAFIISLNIHYQPLVDRFSFPRSRIFMLFLFTFVLFGMSESYWLAYPLFVFAVSTTVLNMGLVVAASALLISIINIGINKISDVRRTRVKFAIISSILYAVWYFVLTQVFNMMEIVALSIVSGFAGAFALSWLAYYGDCFDRKYHAGILVAMEVALMMGRILNLVPTLLFIPANNYAHYFVVLGFVSLLLIPFFVKSKDYAKNLQI
jgi:MFS family permease